MVFQPIALDTQYERKPIGLLLLLGTMTALTLASLQLGWETLLPLVLDPSAVRPWQVVTSTLLHVHPFHLLGNGLFLWVFGRFVEDRLGSVRFLILFLLFGVFGDVVYLWKGPELRAVGASGAISGLMGLVLFTAPRVGIRVSLGWWPNTRYAPPAWFLLGLWIAMNVLGVRRGSGGVGYTAHIGGFLGGCLAAWVLRASLLRGTGWYLTREVFGGERHAEKYGEMLRSEAVWRTIEGRLRERPRNPQTDPPRVYDVDPRRPEQR